MANKKMLILRGNASAAGTFPDEQGKKIAWPIGALHVNAAREYAKRLGYEGIVLPVQGWPQSDHSPQAKAALKAFHADQSVTAFYGFSGGGYNLKHILDYLAVNQPGSLHRIDLIVVIGSPNKRGGKAIYLASLYNARAKQKIKDDDWKDLAWDVVFRENPDPSQLPKGLPKGTPTHMFGPDLLLSGWPEKN
jgi:hypothetical protein